MFSFHVSISYFQSFSLRIVLYIALYNSLYILQSRLGPILTILYLFISSYKDESLCIVMTNSIITSVACNFMHCTESVKSAYRACIMYLYFLLQKNKSLLACCILSMRGSGIYVFSIY